VSGESIGSVERDLRQGSSEARRALEPLRSTLDESQFGDLRLLVSELVADEVRARGGDRGRPLRLSALLGEDILRIELYDDWSRGEAPAQRPEPGEPGWGLYLAGILANRWGIEPASDGSLVWLEVRL
jgi:hypothetical protein